MINSVLPRGYRNNNPCNIRKSPDRFLGEIPDAKDPSFKVFLSMKYGFRAFYKLIKTYNVRYGKKTVSQIISRFAPPTENSTSSYVKVVCGRTGFLPSTEILYTDPLQMVTLACAMAYVENGQECNRDDAWLGYLEFLNDKN